MIELIKLILAHLIGDFLLQPKSWVQDKEKKKIGSPKLYIHVLIHGLLIFILLWDLNYWLLILLLMFSHWVIDVLKVQLKKANKNIVSFFLDQALHVTVIVILWIVFFEPEFNLTALYENQSIWIYSVAILFITVVSGIMVQVLMSNWSKSIYGSVDGSLNNAGKYIGILERIFVFIFVVTDNWEGIGFLLAAKSVFRFGDLKESKSRQLTEYILIGTLLSFGIAIGTGLLVLKIIETT